MNTVDNINSVNHDLKRIQNEIMFLHIFSAPEGIFSPLLQSESPTSVLISWDDPQFPNGIIQTYTIERKRMGSPFMSTVIIQPATSPKQYLDQSNDIDPYTVYKYRIIASTSAGNGYSPWAQVTTKSSRKQHHYAHVEPQMK